MPSNLIRLTSRNQETKQKLIPGAVTSIFLPCTTWTIQISLNVCRPQIVSLEEVFKFNPFLTFMLITWHQKSLTLILFSTKLSDSNWIDITKQDIEVNYTHKLSQIFCTNEREIIHISSESLSKWQINGFACLGPAASWHLPCVQLQLMLVSLQLCLLFQLPSCCLSFQAISQASTGTLFWYYWNHRPVTVSEKVLRDINNGYVFLKFMDLQRLRLVSCYLSKQ